MSSDSRFLALRLEGPFQSWGFESQYNRRTTGLLPTKSGIAGICCAALGYERGSAAETEFLNEFQKVAMISIAIPRKSQYGNLEVQRLEDYHTILGTRTADGKTKDCHITYRHYLVDAAFGVILSGRTALIESMANALQNPIWGLFLGRKVCIPSAPIFAGLLTSEEDAIRKLTEHSDLNLFTHQKDVVNFLDGKDSINDLPMSFNSARRVFAPRRVITKEATT